MAYRLKLPDRLKLHPTIHVSFLKSYHRDSGKERVQEVRAPLLVMKQFDQKVEQILDHRTMGASRKTRRTDYLVKWKGKEISEATWEKDVTLWQFEKQEYLKNKSMRVSTSTGGGGFVSPSQT